MNNKINKSDKLLDNLQKQGKKSQETLNITQEDIDNAIKEVRYETWDID